MKPVAFCHLACTQTFQQKPNQTIKPNAVGPGGLPRASDLDEAGQAQAERCVHGHGRAVHGVPVQAQHLQLGEVHHVHHTAEAADGELCRHKRDGEAGGELEKPSVGLLCTVWDYPVDHFCRIGVIPMCTARGRDSKLSAPAALFAPFPGPQPVQDSSVQEMSLSVLAAGTCSFTICVQQVEAAGRQSKVQQL